ncbi:hypothetical protein [Haloferula sargassicola]
MFPRLMISGVLAVLLPSCGLIRAPFKIAGGLVEGTAKATKAAVNAPGEALEKRKQRKAAEKKKQEAKDKAAARQGSTFDAADPTAMPPPEPTVEEPLPAQDELPLPE